MQMVRTRTVSAFAIAMAVALSFAGPPARAQAVLDIGNGAPTESLDPARSIGTQDARIVQELFEGLVMLEASGDVVPGAAARWSTSPDGLVWTFALRPEGKWSDGSPVTADDFVFSLRRAADPATRAADPRDLYAIKGAEAIATGKAKPDTLGVRAVDPLTVEITLERPAPDFLIQLSNRTAFPVNRKALATHGDLWTRPGNLIGNGPFILAENVPQTYVKLVRNPNFRDLASVKLDAVVFHQTEDANTALKRFRAGELDVSYASPINQIEWMQQNLGPEFRVSPSRRVFYLTPNFTREPWKSEPRLRKALSLAIDREAIAARVTRGIDAPAHTMIPPGVGGYRPIQPATAQLTQAQRDAMAKALLAEAGYGPGGKPLEVELIYQTDESRKQVSIAIAAMWQSKLGVKVSLVNQEARVVWDRLRDRNFGGFIYDSWIDRLPVRFLDVMVSTETQNNGGYANTAFDAKIAAAMSTPDVGRHLAILAEAEAMLLDDAAVIPVVFQGGRALVSSKVQGWRDSPIQLTPLRGVGLRE